MTSGELNHARKCCRSAGQATKCNMIQPVSPKFAAARKANRNPGTSSRLNAAWVRSFRFSCRRREEEFGSGQRVSHLATVSKKGAVHTTKCDMMQRVSPKAQPPERPTATRQLLPSQRRRVRSFLFRAAATNGTKPHNTAQSCTTPPRQTPPLHFAEIFVTIVYRRPLPKAGSK